MKDLQEDQTQETSSTLYGCIGRRLKERRKALDMSQTRIAELLGLSYQQVQKYESGLNQLSLSRLLQFAKVLNVPPEYFYEGAPVDEKVGESLAGDVIKKKLGRPLQILLVEDNPGDVLLFERAVQNNSLVVLDCVNDTESVMDHINNFQARGKGMRPDLVILDLNMPKIGGLQLLKMIKGNSQTADLPVLILTNSISRKEMTEAYRLGCAGFLQKSLNFKEFKESIEIVMRYWSDVVAIPSA